MKRIILALLITLTAISYCEPANAGYFADKKAQIVQNYELISAKKAIINVLKKQAKYASKYDCSGLSSLYAADFKSGDGFNKEVYFKLIEDTWKSYPDITYTTDIKDVKIDGTNAEVDVYETSLATSTQMEENVTIYGELNSESNSTYYLKKINNKWLFTGEKIDNEKTSLKYGDTRFVKMDLDAPHTVKPGEYYTSSLTIDAPENSFFIASIARDKIVYPQEKTEEVFRKLPDDNILERMFYANKDGKNEYNIASVGMSKSRIYGFDKVQVYMAGIAFLMTRVNVEEENAEKDK